VASGDEDGFVDLMQKGRDYLVLRQGDIDGFSEP
jgi:hypothetical protein